MFSQPLSILILLIWSIIQLIAAMMPLIGALSMLPIASPILPNMPPIQSHIALNAPLMLFAMPPNVLLNQLPTLEKTPLMLSQIPVNTLLMLSHISPDFIPSTIALHIDDPTEMNASQMPLISTPTELTKPKTIAGITLTTAATICGIALMIASSIAGRLSSMPVINAGSASANATMIAGITLTTASTICGIASAIALMISGRASARAMMITGITDITALTISPACSSTVVTTATTNCITCCNIVGKSSTRNATILSIIIPMFACIVGSAEIKPETMFSTAATAASKNAGMCCMSLRKKSPMPAQKLVTASYTNTRSKLAIQLMALHALDRKFFTAENPDASEEASFLPAFLSAVFIALSVAASRVTPNNALTT